MLLKQFIVMLRTARVATAMTSVTTQSYRAQQICIMLRINIDAVQVVTQNCYSRIPGVKAASTLTTLTGKSTTYSAIVRGKYRRSNESSPNATTHYWARLRRTQYSTALWVEQDLFVNRQATLITYLSYYMHLILNVVYMSCALHLSYWQVVIAPPPYRQHWE